jgi:hypothetical protein
MLLLIFMRSMLGIGRPLPFPDLRIIEGSLPRRAISLVLEWAFLHREELAENWRRAERREDLARIKPLD